MSGTEKQIDEKKGDEILWRMLKTPPIRVTHHSLLIRL